VRPGAHGVGSERGEVSPRSGLALFVFAHHDDEVFCAGHLARVLHEGRPVRVLWATAGGLAPAGRRVAEGERVRAALGLSGSAARDLRLADQAAVAGVGRIAQAVDDLVGSAEAPVVYVPAYEGGHPDHDAVNLALAVVRLGRPWLQVREFPLYRRGGAGLSVQALLSPPGVATPAGDTLPLDDEALRLRRRLVWANASQAAVSLLPLLALARLAGRGRVEESRVLPSHDYTRPPHQRPLLYELYTRRRFDEFRRVASLALSPDRTSGASGRA